MKPPIVEYCVCCGTYFHNLTVEAPRCNACDEARQPLLAEIARLHYELTRRTKG